MRWVPDSTRRKLENRWEGPMVVEKVISDVIVVVEGIEEHVYNLKRFIGQQEISRKRRISIDDDQPSKKSKVASVMVKPRGMLLWI